MAWQGVVLNVCMRDEVARMLGVDNHVCEVQVVPRGGEQTCKVSTSKHSARIQDRDTVTGAAHAQTDTRTILASSIAQPVNPVD
jgi:hypothetical protein